MEIPNFEELVVEIGFKDKLDELREKGEEGKEEAKKLVQEAKEKLKESLSKVKKEISDSFDKVKFKTEQFVQAIPACAIEIASIPAAVGTPFTISTAPTFINNGIKSIGTLQCTFKDLVSEFNGLTGKLEMVGITADVLPEPLKTTYDTIKKVIDTLSGQIPSVPEIATLTIKKIEVVIDMETKEISSGIPSLYMMSNGTDSYTFDVDSIINTISPVISVFIKGKTYTSSSYTESMYTVKFGEEKVVPKLTLYYISTP